jgi:hypothetical protein
MYDGAEKCIETGSKVLMGRDNMGEPHVTKRMI